MVSDLSQRTDDETRGAEMAAMLLSESHEFTSCGKVIRGATTSNRAEALVVSRYLRHD